MRPAKPSVISTGLEERNRHLLSLGIPEIPESAPPVKIKGSTVVSISSPAFKKHYQFVSVKDLEHLKALIGVPDRSHETNNHHDPVPFPMNPKVVPDRSLGDLSELSREEQLSVFRAAQNLVYGHSRGLKLTDNQRQNVESWILQRAKSLSIFLAPSLEVMDGATVTFTDAAILRFKSITVHGTGSIQIQGMGTKVITDQHNVA